MDSKDSVLEKCCTCGKGFIGNSNFISRCPECEAAWDADNQKRLMESRRETARKVWLQTCPPLYRESDVTQVPNKSATELALTWKYGPKGLLLHGNTGTGKTRTAWLVMKRLIINEFREVQTFDSVSFGHEVSRRFSSYDADDPNRWIEWMTSIDLVFFDDLGKCRLTERVESELFGIIESRIANKKPLLITTNTVGDSLASQLSQDRGEPLVRRLREFCMCVAF